MQLIFFYLLICFSLFFILVILLREKLVKEIKPFFDKFVIDKFNEKIVNKHFKISTRRISRRRFRHRFSIQHLGALGVGLLVLMIVFSVTIIVGDQIKSEVCGLNQGTYNGTCSVVNAGYEAANQATNMIQLVLGFVAMTILILIVSVLIRTARDF